MNYIFYIVDKSFEDNLQARFLNSVDYKLINLTEQLLSSMPNPTDFNLQIDTSILLMQSKFLAQLERINTLAKFSFSILINELPEKTFDDKDRHHIEKFDLIYSDKEDWKNIEKAILTLVNISNKSRADTILNEEESLFKKSSKIFHTLFNEMSDGGVILETTDSGKSFFFKDVNKSSINIEGRKREDYLGFKFEDVFPGSIDSGLMEEVEKVFSTSIPKRCTIKIEQDSKTVYIHENYIYKISETEVVILYNDVTYQTKMLSALEKSETLYRSLYNNIPSGLLLIDDNFIIKDVNQSTCNITGYTRGELVGKSCSKICPRDIGNDECPFWSVLDSRVEEMNTVIKGKDSRVIPVIKNSRKLHISDNNYLMESFLDISAMKKAEEQIAEDLDEKKILLREIHHRVKNNLNIITSLLNIQSKKINSPEQAIEAFDNSKMRIYSMALVHDVLYKSHNLKRIPFKEYVDSLVNYYITVFEGKNVTFEVDIQKEKLSVNKALNCGLLINELVTNSMKHAFGSQDKGIIRISLRTTGENYILSVADDGIGIADDKRVGESNFGMQLVGMLVSQLSGQIRSNNEGGTIFEVRFKKD